MSRALSPPALARVLLALCVPAACGGEGGDASVVRDIAYEGVFSLLDDRSLVQVLEAPPAHQPDYVLLEPRASGSGDHGQRLCIQVRAPTVLAYDVPYVDTDAVLQYRVAISSDGYQGEGLVRVTATFDAQPLFEHELSCEQTVPQEDRRWWPHQVPLPAGGRLEIEFEYEGVQGQAPLVGLADLRLALPFEREEAHSSTDDPNVILIVIDTLRADRLHCYGHPLETSPNMDRLAKGGMRFESAFSSGPWTVPGTASILTGRSSPSHGLGDTEASNLSDRLTSLPELFRRDGCTTAAFSTNPLISESRNFHQGFDRFDAHDWSSGAVLREGLAEWVANIGERRFFAYIHFTDPHAPYKPTMRTERRFGIPPAEELPVGNLRLLMDAWYAGEEQYDLQTLEQTNALRLQRYDGEIWDVDHEIGLLLADLREHGLLDRTLICVTADHGEEFLEHGLIGHYNQLHIESLGVPLILWGPGVPKGAVVSDPVENRFVAPTLLRRAGIEIPQGNFHLAGPDLTLAEERAVVVTKGVHATANKGRAAVVAQRAAKDLGPLFLLRDDGWALIHHAGADDKEAQPFDLLFDLAADPLELVDVSKQHPDRVREMRTRLLAWVASERDQQPQLAPPTQETLELLRSIGYIGDSED